MYVNDNVGVRDVRYIRFLSAEFQMFKMCTDVCSLIKSMVTLYIPTCTFVFRHLSKAIPLQALTGPEGSRRLRLPDVTTVGT
jgi:hypothetical protein